MNAAVPLPGAAGAQPIVSPDILIEGLPDDALVMRRLETTGPLDQRIATLMLQPDSAEGPPASARRAQQLVGQRLAALWPATLGDRTAAYLPLFNGRIVGVDRVISDSDDAHVVRAECAWTDMLGRPLPQPIEAGALIDVVRRLVEATGVELDTAGLPADVQRLRADGASAGSSLAHALGSICRSFGLFVRREMTWAGGRIFESAALIAAVNSRPIRLAVSADPASSSLAALHRASADPLPTVFRAEAEGQVVESTFALTPAWDVDAENLPDSAYAKSTSDNFDAVREVFRLWMLNEDAALDAAHVDLTALFDESRFIPPQPLRFGPTLTFDGQGHRMEPLVEFSVDGGNAWHTFPGAVDLLDRRAGVYLDSDALPAGFVEAARGGLARVRVTATLRSPMPIVAERWVGNPFVGPFRRRRFAVGERFARRRVLPTSRFHADVASGVRFADQRDDRRAMDAWLIQRTAESRDGQRTTTIHTAGIQPAVGIGDGLEAIVRPPGTNAGVEAAAGGRRLCVRRLVHRWDRAETVIDLVTLEGPA